MVVYVVAEVVSVVAEVVSVVAEEAMSRVFVVE